MDSKTLYCLVSSDIPEIHPETGERNYSGAGFPEVFDSSMAPWKPAIFTGTPEQLDAIRALDTVLGLLVTSEGEPELDELVDEAFRVQVNALTAAYSKPALAEGVTNREMVSAGLALFNERFPVTAYTVAG